MFVCYIDASFPVGGFGGEPADRGVVIVERNNRAYLLVAGPSRIIPLPAMAAP